MTETLARVRALRPMIRDAAPKIAEARRLTAEVVRALKEAGVFRMAFARSWGGPEMPLLDQIDVLEELSYADGSVGWAAMIGCDSGYYAAFLDQDVAHALYPDLDMVTAGYTAPSGTASAAAVDGGFRVGGRWTFGSGITHADRIIAGAMLSADPGDGRFPFRSFFLPQDEVEIIDTWHTTGLQGTGSNDYALAETVIPAEHAFYPLDPMRIEGPLYGLSWWFIVKVAAVPLGLARRAIDELSELAAGKLSMPTFKLLRDESRTQVAVARAESLRRSARAFLDDTIGDAWSTLEAGGEVDARQRASIRLAMAHTSSACREAIELLYDTAGTTAIFRGHPLDQILRDAITAGQHLVLNSKNLEAAGRVLLGLDPASPMY